MRRESAFGNEVLTKSEEAPPTITVEEIKMFYSNVT